MQLESYKQIAEACDQILESPDATPDWIAIPWLHVLSQHPIMLRDYGHIFEEACSRGLDARAGFRGLYHGITRHQIALIRDLARSATHRKHAEFPPHGLGPVDVVIVSWLVHVGHLDMTDDFYFGDLQSRLARRGLSSLLVLRNRTGHPTASLISRARRDGPGARLMIPDVPSLFKQLSFLRRCWRASRELGRAATDAKSPLHAITARAARYHAVSHPTLENLILHANMLELCRRTQPFVLITLYEGYAWERCVWHAVRSAAPETLCAGYQHTVIFKDSHALKRSLNRNYDPDLVLTTGPVPRRMLESSARLTNVHFVTFGTHRYALHTAEPGPRQNATFLVLPEGYATECVYLFQFALHCARRLPDARFIFRTHPVLPFERIERKLLRRGDSWPKNVEISRGKPIDEDFARAGYLLYRGSSSVIYGVLAGLKPFYVSKAGEIDFDPLYELECWRERVDSVEDLIGRYRTHQGRSMAPATSEWSIARDYCASYVQPVQDSAIDEMLEQVGISGTGHLIRTPELSDLSPKFISAYFDECSRIASQLDVKTIDQMVQRLVRLREESGRLFLCGVGGSAGNCSHAVNDFRKLAGVDACTPVDNVSELTARINDEGWETCFSAWLEASHPKSRDVLMILSVGGGSRDRNISTNLVAVIDEAKHRQMDVLGIVGRDGGYTKLRGDIVLIVPTLNADHVTPHTEAFQAVVWHAIVSDPRLMLNANKWESGF